MWTEPMEIYMHRGRLEVIIGGMFSGKSEELIRRLRRARIAGLGVRLFKPAVDTRSEGVSTHAGSEESATPIKSAEDLLDPSVLPPGVRVIGVDEVQFLEGDVTGVLNGLASQGVRVIAAGLDLDYRGDPFGSMPELACLAEELQKLRAVCVVCGADACRTFRTLNSEALVEIGASESYEARCRTHFDEGIRSSLTSRQPPEADSPTPLA
jgi:thymidine kinase